MIVAFDFDKTLSDVRVQRLARKMIQEKNEVWVVSARKESEYNKDIIRPILSKIGLSEYSVMYCDEKPKWEILMGINADIYIDNISTEFQIISNHTYTVPLLFSGH